MTHKKLHITAIIPDEIYVQRDADRQLAEVIARMSKPAYISVARQMGKTNLLLHTKRKLEDEKNRFVYIDITNQFNSAQDCFRYIIDQVIDANEDIPEFIEASKVIKLNRPAISENPTKEYQDGLREVLKRFKGNLIIFLDEVDALRKYDFSDEIFAQIRKTYFVRVTYSVFNRLTYVLSGVIDPERLIKNKDNSPFNISIPIYLGDFSKSEFDELVQKSQIEISPQVKQYIYDWLQGNPRMSYDVLSQLEDLFLSGIELTRSHVDSVIQKIYLEDYKHPPIDHIRDIVKRYTDIRRAVLKIKKGESNELTDEIKNKLYLYGIIGVRTKKDILTIKNKVIDEALSFKWLEQIDVEKKGYYELGIENIGLGYYKEGIKYLVDFINNSPNHGYVQLARFEIGRSYWELKEYEQSNKYLLDRPITKEESATGYFNQLQIIGINYWKTKKTDEAIEIFNEIIEDKRVPSIAINAFLNKAAIYFEKGIIAYPHSEATYLEAAKYLEENQEKVEAPGNIFAIIFYKLGYLNYIKGPGNYETASHYFFDALKYAKEEQKPLVLLQLDSIFKNDLEKRKEFHLEVSKIILDNKLAFQNDPVLFFNQHLLFIILINLKDFGLHEHFNELFQYSLENLFKEQSTETELYYQLGAFAISVGDNQVGEGLLKNVINSSREDKKSKMLAFQSLGLEASNKKDINQSILYFLRYVELFDTYDNFNELPDSNAYYAFVQLMAYLRAQNKLEESYNIGKIIEKKFYESPDIDIKSQIIVILFFIMDYFLYKGSIEDALQYAQRNLTRIKELSSLGKEIKFIDKTVLEDIESQTKKAIRDSNKIKPEIRPFQAKREKGRNEWVKVKYKNGNEAYGKYKRFMHDIESGLCILIE